MSNPRNDQAALERQHDEQNHLKREPTIEESLRISGYADAMIQRDKLRGHPVPRYEYAPDGQLIRENR